MEMTRPLGAPAASLTAAGRYITEGQHTAPAVPSARVEFTEDTTWR